MPGNDSLLNEATNMHVGDTQSWLTPKRLVDALGGYATFDLDPCCPPEGMPWRTAKRMFRYGETDGLKETWEGRVWMNPPYARDEIDLWMEKLARHMNGIALVYARMDTLWCQRYVLDRATSILFLKGRLRFVAPDGTPAPAPAGAPSMLIAYGQDCDELLRQSDVQGRIVRPFEWWEDGRRRGRRGNGASAGGEAVARVRPPPSRQARVDPPVTAPASGPRTCPVSAPAEPSGPSVGR